MKCANCNNTATVTVTYDAARPVNYCDSCLPDHLRELTGPIDLPAPAKRTKKKAVNEDLSGTSEAGPSDTE